MQISLIIKKIRTIEPFQYYQYHIAGSEQLRGNNIYAMPNLPRSGPLLLCS